MVKGGEGREEDDKRELKRRIEIVRMMERKGCEERGKK